MHSHSHVLSNTLSYRCLSLICQTQSLALLYVPGCLQVLYVLWNGWCLGASLSACQPNFLRSKRRLPANSAFEPIMRGLCASHF